MKRRLPPPYYNSKEAYQEEKMPRITNEQLYREMRELKIALFGVPDTEDNGFYGEVRREIGDIIKLLREMNGTVKSDHAWVCALKWVVGLLALGLIGTITAGKMGLW